MNASTKTLLLAVLIGVAALGTQIAPAADAARAQLIEVFTLPKTSLQALAPTNHTYNLEQARASGLTDTDLASIGSSLARRSDGALFGLTDRGPNDMVKLPKKKGGDRRVLPVPDFCPAIVRIELTNHQIALRETIPLTGAHGRLLTGQGNGPGEEIGYASALATKPLPPDPGGVDPEGIDCLPDGRFVMSEEYSPSICIVSPAGEILVRYTPESKPLMGAPYAVRPILPDILKERRTNRGFESVTVSSDAKTAYAILQSPMGDDQDPAYAGSRIVRVLELDFTDPLKARVTGMFLLRDGDYHDYPQTKRQDQVKINDAKWLGPRRLLVIEQAKGEARLLEVDLNDATNVLNHPDAGTLKFENVATDLTTLNLQPAKTRIVFDTADVPAIDSDKLEGLAVLSPDRVALSNDNDFGIGENQLHMPSKVWVIRLPQGLSLK